MKRRTFLQKSMAGVAAAFAGSSGLLTWVPRVQAAVISKTFYITEGYIKQPDETQVYFKGFSSNANGLDVPGAALIVQEGDSVEITIANTLGSNHSFVIDGMVDSGIIAGGQTKKIRFTVGAPGSYLFYDKLAAPYNRLVGLHGGFAVMPATGTNELYPGSPTFVQQYLWLINEIDPLWNTQIEQGVLPNTKYKPRYFTINGRSMRVPGHPDYGNPDIDAGYNPDTRLVGSIGDRTLVRILNAGLAIHSMHFHANHVEWLARNRQIRADIWEKDSLLLPNNKGSLDVIYPFQPPVDAWPPVTTGHFPMHLHDEMTQTAGGGLYQFGAATTISFK
ncbi:MAG: multicopper oxidase domain-containing protein [Gammaproteobacteria bacterium]|nr:multicopper oxidase domain-containing protein [Gammaproteobacteria bacterium]